MMWHISRSSLLSVILLLNVVKDRLSVVFFLKLDDVSELYDDCGWEKIEDEMDVAVFSCLSQTEIFDYFYDWHPHELADARIGIDNYVKNHTPIITQKNNLFNYFSKK